MIEVLSRYILLMIGTALITYVSIRAGDYPPSRLLIGVIVIFIGISLNSALRQTVLGGSIAYALAAMNVVLLGLITVVMLLLLSRIFIPEWWQGRQAIRWITLPYLVVISFLLFDLIAQTGWFFVGIVEIGDRTQLQMAQPWGGVALSLFTASWLVHIGVLISAFIRHPEERKIITILTIGLMSGIVSGMFFSRIPQLASIETLVMAIPVLTSLTYAVLGSRLLFPTQAAFDLAIEAIRDAVLVIAPNGALLYANPTAQKLGFTSDEMLVRTFVEAGLVPVGTPHLSSALIGALPSSQMLTITGRQLIVDHAPVKDQRGHILSQVVLGRDVTELEQRSAQLEAERTHLAVAVQNLEARERERDALSITVRALALPVIPILDHVIVIPLVGDFNQERANDLQKVLLPAIVREQAYVVLIDITGIVLLDHDGATALFKATEAAVLLGARCTLVGMRPEIAETLVILGVNFENLGIAATLQQGLQSAMKLMDSHKRLDSTLR